LPASQSLVGSFASKLAATVIGTGTDLKNVHLFRVSGEAKARLDGVPIAPIRAAQRGTTEDTGVVQARPVAVLASALLRITVKSNANRVSILRRALGGQADVQAIWTLVERDFGVAAQQGDGLHWFVAGGLSQ
jgi:hypothetical protein